MSIAAPDFHYIRDLVHRKSAIVLDDGKEYLAETRLQPLVRNEGMTSVADLVSHLRKVTAGPLHEQVVDALTTNETSWFRDIHPFESLRTEVLPELIERNKVSRSLRIWCGASSSGQEPYTLALVMREHFPELAGWRVDITATDISPSMVERARNGRYSQIEINRGLPAKLLVRWFTQDGTTWVIDPSIRDMVRYSTMNLAAPWPPMAPVDLVLMRNVLIYFDVPTKRTILGKVHDLLRPNGLLLLGGSETTLNLDDRLARVVHGRTTWYRKEQP
jgi:chemotaxis protein methyltransferase CheR